MALRIRRLSMCLSRLGHTDRVLDRYRECERHLQALIVDLEGAMQRGGPWVRYHKERRSKRAALLCWRRKFAFGLGFGDQVLIPSH
jgi:hypothetical protein